MIIWGSRGKGMDLGQHSTQHCPLCERDRPFHVVLPYHYWHLCWVFCVMTKKRYLLRCAVCGHGVEMKAADVEKSLGKHPIPFMHRMGMAVAVAAVLLVVLVNNML